MEHDKILELIEELGECKEIISKQGKAINALLDIAKNEEEGKAVSELADMVRSGEVDPWEYYDTEEPRVASALKVNLEVLENLKC